MTRVRERVARASTAAGDVSAARGVRWSGGTGSAGRAVSKGAGWESERRSGKCRVKAVSV